VRRPRPPRRTGSAVRTVRRAGSMHRPIRFAPPDCSPRRSRPATPRPTPFEEPSGKPPAIGSEATSSSLGHAYVPRSRPC
jgi:hypothetical protein